MATMNWTEYQNGDTLLNLRVPLNTFNSAVATQVNLNTSGIATNVTNTNSLTARVVELETTHTLPVISLSSGTKAQQDVVANTPEILQWMSNALVDQGGTVIEYTLGTSRILVKEAGVYEVFGNMSLIAPINDIVDIELYIDNIPTGFISSAIGRGDESIISFQNSFLAQFDINDDIDLYVKSTGTKVTLQSATMTVAKTEY